MNPVTRRELQERFRTVRSPLLLSAWVAAAGAVTFLAYLVARNAAESAVSNLGLASLGSVVAASSMGRFILHAVLLGLLTAIVFVVPGQAAVSIVGERERQTLPLLQVSQLSAFGIVWGKLLSAIAFLLLLLVAAVPLLVIPGLLGGVKPMDVARGVLIVAVAALMIGAVSIWVSARAKTVQGAVLGAYVWTAVLVFGSLGLTVAEVLLAAPEDTGRTRYVAGVPRDEGREIYSAWLNPYIALADASDQVLELRTDLVDSPYEPIKYVLYERQGLDAAVSSLRIEPVTRFPVEPGFGGGVIGIPNARNVGQRTVEPIRGAVWWRFILFAGLAVALTTWRATMLVKVPRRRRRRASSRLMWRRRSHAAP